MGKAVQALYDQDSFRGRTNVPDPSGVNAAFDAGDAGVNDNWTQDVDTLFRIRFLIQQTVATANNNIATEFLVQYNKNGGGWTDVAVQSAVTDAVRYANGDFADGDDTTQLVGSGSFVTGDGVEVTPTDTISFTEAALSETEIEFALEIYSGQVADEDIIELRLLFSLDDETPPATVLNSYTNTPSLTVNEAASHDITLNQVTETGLAQAMSASKDSTIGQVTESDLVQGMSVSKSATISQVTETDLAQAMDPEKDVLIGQVSETDIAQPFSAGGPHNITLNQVAETDLAQGFTATKSCEIGQVSETDLAQGFVATKSCEIGQVTEADLAQSLSIAKSREIGQVFETDIAQPFTVSGGPHNITLNQVVETDIAQGMSVGIVSGVPGVVQIGGGGRRGPSGFDYAREKLNLEEAEQLLDDDEVLLIWSVHQDCEFDTAIRGERGIRKWLKSR